MVFSNVGLARLPAIASISQISSAKARLKAGRTCSGRIWSNGGISNGVVQGASSGFCDAAALGLDAAPPGARALALAAAVILLLALAICAYPSP